MSAAAARTGMRTYRALRLGVVLARWAPAPLADALCHLAGRASYLAAEQARSNVLANLSHVLPHADEATLRRTAKRTFYYTARSYYELVRLPALAPATLLRQFRPEHWERLEAAMTAGRGVIIVASHLGSFNTVPSYGMARGLPLVSMMEVLQPPALNDLVLRLRSSHGMRLIPTGAEGVRAALGVLRRGEALVLAGDRDVTGSGVSVPFFGWPARLPAGPAALALRTGAVLLPMYTVREGRDRSAIVALEPVEPMRTGDRAADIVATTARLAGALEVAIGRAPAQWAVLQAIWENAEPGAGLLWPRETRSGGE